MGKSAKARKKADFQKVKLKAGRKIPKGHVTDTSFKAGKLILTEQMKEKSGEQPLTHRKLALQDLLNQLRHTSPKTRTDALHGIQELWRGYPALIQRSLFQVARVVFAMFTDGDSGVRKTVVALLRDILVGLSSTEFSPHFPLLVAYIGCGLTHTNPEIKRGTMELILNPLLSAHGDLIVTNWDLIKRVLSIVPGAAGKTDKNNPGTAENQQKMTSMTSRGHLVQLLGRLTELMVTQKRDVGSDSSQNSDVGRNQSDELPCNNKISLEIFNYSTPFLVPISSGLVKNEKTGGNTDHGGKGTMSTDGDGLVEYFRIIVPFVVEFWTEISRMDGDFQTIDVANLSYEKWEQESMRIVLGILAHFLQCCCKFTGKLNCNTGLDQAFRKIVENSLMTKYESKFFNMFPISSKVTAKGNEKMRNWKFKKSGLVDIFKSSSVIENTSAIVNLLLVRVNALLLRLGLSENSEKHTKFLRTYFGKFAQKATWEVLSQGLETAEIVAFSANPTIVEDFRQNELWADVLRFSGNLDRQAVNKSLTLTAVCRASTGRLNNDLIHSLGWEVWHKFTGDLCEVLPIMTSRWENDANQQCIVAVCAYFSKQIMVDGPESRTTLLANIAALLDSVAELSLHAEESQLRDWFGLIYRLFPLDPPGARSVAEVLTERSSGRYVEMQVRLVQLMFTWMREELWMVGNDHQWEMELLMMLKLTMTVILGPNRDSAAKLLDQSQRHNSTVAGTDETMVTIGSEAGPGHITIELDQTTMDFAATERILAAVGSGLSDGGLEMRRMGTAIVRKLIGLVECTRVMPFSIAWSIARFLRLVDSDAGTIGSINTVIRLNRSLKTSLKIWQAGENTEFASIGIVYLESITSL